MMPLAAVGDSSLSAWLGYGKVIHDANCPVWTDAHAREEGRLIDVAIPSILCSVDDKEEHLDSQVCGGSCNLLLSQSSFSTCRSQAWRPLESLEREVGKRFD
jgi:hypothetical protein